MRDEWVLTPYERKVREVGNRCFYCSNREKGVCEKAASEHYHQLTQAYDSCRYFKAKKGVYE